MNAVYDFATGKCIGECDCVIGEQCKAYVAGRLGRAEALLRRIADAGVIFPSMCANNMEAMNIVDELNHYRSPAAKERPK